MFDFINTFLTQPVVLVFQSVYDGIQLVVHNKGSALFALSLVTVFMMIPLERAVRGSVRREKITERILAPQIKKINQLYKGAERNAALKRLYSRYSYNPLSSVKATFSILVQLPFLFGAYWMLSGDKGLEGYHYSFIKDLSRPDALLFGFNLLPFVMTAINLATTAISGFSKREAVQAVIIALLFAVLLYQAPAALLIYWTTNNLIHFFRALYKRIQERSHDKDMKTHGVKGRFISKVAYGIKNLSPQIVLCSVLLVLLSVLKITASLTNKNGWTIATYLTLALLLGVLAKPVIESLILNRNSQTLAKVIKLISLVFAFFTALKITAFAVLDATKHHLGQYALVSAILLLVSSNTEKLSWGFRFFAWKYLSKEQRAINAGWTKIGVVSLALAYVSSFVIVPMRFYAQNKTELWFTGSSLAAHVAITAIVFFLFLYYVVSRVVIPKKISVFLLMLCTCVIVQNFIWPQQIKEFIGNKYDWLGSPLTWLNLALWITLLTGGVYLCIKKKTFRQVALGFNCLALMVVCVSSLMDARDKTDTVYGSVAFDKKNEFGLGDQNIIVFLLDTLDQNTMEELSNSDHNTFMKLFRGFTWYKNNLGSGPTTGYSVPVIFTGSFISRDEEYSHYLTRAFSEHNALDDALEQGFKTRIYSHGWLFPVNAVDKIANAMQNRSWGYGDINASALKNLRSIVFYNLSPDLMRMYLPQDSELFNNNRPKVKSGIDFYYVSDPSFYDDFKRHPFSANERGKYFIFYHLNGAHPPYGVDINGKRIQPGLPGSSKHDQVLGCLLQLQKMFDRLSEIGKFKDSLIVVMSDHGYHYQEKTSYPVLFVKPAGTDADTQMAISNEPTGHKYLFSSLIKNGKPALLDERVVIDRDSNLWKAPEVLTGDPNSFVSIQSKASINENSDYTTEGFEPADPWGRWMRVNAVIHFREPKEELIKMCFGPPASPECNGYVNFEENGKNTRFYIGGQWARVIYKRTGKDLKITSECRIAPHIPDKEHFLAYHSIRMKTKYGLYDVLTKRELRDEFFAPKAGVTTSLGGDGPQGNIFLSGFNFTIPDGRWSLGKTSQIVFKRSGDNGLFTLRLHPFTYGSLKKQRVVIKNEKDQIIKEVSLSSDTDVTLNVADFMSEFEGIPLVKVTFNFPDARSPASLNMNKDQSKLAVKFMALTVSER